jgi:hypothetical protein
MKRKSRHCCYCVCIITFLITKKKNERWEYASYYMRQVQAEYPLENFHNNWRTINKRISYGENPYNGKILSMSNRYRPWHVKCGILWQKKSYHLTKLSFPYCHSGTWRNSEYHTEGKPDESLNQYLKKCTGEADRDGTLCRRFWYLLFAFVNRNRDFSLLKSIFRDHRW